MTAVLILTACVDNGAMMTPIGHFEIAAAWFQRVPVPSGEWTVVVLSNMPLPCASITTLEDPDLHAAAVCGEGAAHVGLRMWRPWNQERAGDYVGDELLDLWRPPDEAGRLWRGDAYAVLEAEWPELEGGVRLPDVTDDVAATGADGGANLVDVGHDDALAGDFAIDDAWSGRFTAAVCPDWGWQDLLIAPDPGLICP